MISKEEVNQIRIRLQEMQNEWVMLSETLQKRIQDPHPDQLELQRLKKQKIKLEEAIRKLEESLVPDVPA